MAAKRSNSLRDYHLLIKREPDGFEWQIRYDRHAVPVQRSAERYATQSEASQAGEDALAAVKRNVLAGLS